MKSARFNVSLLILLLIPLSLLLVSGYFLSHNGNLFLHCVDPEYAYLFNGVTMAHLNPDVYCVGHPGTPVQVMIALVSFIIHLFRNGQPFWRDVMQNPELYLRAVAFTGLVINVLMLFFMGQYVYKITRKLAYALLLQSAPFTHMVIIDSSYRVIPEQLMIAIACLWFMLMVKYMYDQFPDKKKYSMSFGLLYGFSIATKLTFLPFFILPLIILTSWRSQIRFVLVALVSFAVFAFPVLFNFERFFGFVSVIASHKGRYGMGDNGFIDWPSFVGNLRLMHAETGKLIIPIILLVVFILIRPFIKRKHPTGRAHAQISIGIFVVVAFQYFITAKQFALFYLTPSLLLTVFVIFLLFKGIEDTIHQKINLTKAALFIYLIWIFFSIRPFVIGSIHFRNKVIGEKTKAFEHIAPLLKNAPRIISPSYYGCSSVEYALLFGLQESGKHKEELGKIKNSIYGESYLFFSWSGLFYYGAEEVGPESFLKPETTYVLYLAEYSQEKYDQILSTLQKVLPDCRAHTELKFQSQTTGEAVYSLVFKQNQI